MLGNINIKITPLTPPVISKSKLRLFLKNTEVTIMQKKSEIFI